MSTIFDNNSLSIGNTPLVRLGRITEGAGATVVVEAGARSGAANTAAWARALGRSVCAVPGPVTSSVSVGCHALLRGGANVVTRAEDGSLVVTPLGRLLVRNVAMVFDAYLPEQRKAGKPMFSKTV